MHLVWARSLAGRRQLTLITVVPLKTGARQLAGVVFSGAACQCSARDAERAVRRQRPAGRSVPTDRLRTRTWTGTGR